MKCVAVIDNRPQGNEQRIFIVYHKDTFVCESNGEASVQPLRISGAGFCGSSG